MSSHIDPDGRVAGHRRCWWSEGLPLKNQDEEVDSDEFFDDEDDEDLDEFDDELDEDLDDDLDDEEFEDDDLDLDDAD